MIGGGELYRAALPVAGRIYLTIVDAEPGGDTHMPELDPMNWREHSSQAFAADDKHRHNYRFAIYERIAA